MHFPTNFLAIFAFSFLLIGVTLSMRSSKKTEEEGEKDENQAELETEKLNPGGQQGISIPGRRMSKLLQVGKLTQQNSDVSRDEHIENDWDPEGRHDMTMPGRVFGYFDKKSSIPGNEDYFDKWDTEGPEAISIASRDRILNPQPIIREEQWPIADPAMETNEQDVDGSGKHEIDGGSSTKQLDNKPEEYIPIPSLSAEDYIYIPRAFKHGALIPPSHATSILSSPL